MKTKKLNEVAKVIAGQSPPSATYNKDGEGLPFFQGKADFQRKHPKVRSWCTAEKCKLAEQGDILMSVRAPVGPVNICDQKAIIGRGISAIRPSDGIHGEYLYYFFKTHENKIASLGTGTTFKAITIETLNKLQVPIPHKNDKPDLEDQIRIATLLSRVEALIAARKNNLQQLDNFLKSTFLDMFGDPVRNEKGWETLSFNEVGKFFSGGTPNKKHEEFWVGSFPWVSPIDMKITYLEDSQDHISESVFNETSQKKIPVGSVLIVVRGMILVHSFPVAINKTEVAINQDMKAIIPAESILDEYLLACLVAMKRKILSLVTAAGHGTRRFDSDAMKKLYIPIPPKGSQEHFAQLAKRVVKIKNYCESNLIGLENLYGVLSQKAFKGELDLSRVSLPEEPGPIVHDDNIADQVAVSDEISRMVEYPMSDRDERKKLLHCLLNDYLKEQQGKMFSLDDFWQQADFKVLDYMDESDQSWGMKDYDQVKDWLFELIREGKLEQAFVEDSGEIRDSQIELTVKG